MRRADGAADPFEAAYSRKLVVNVQDYVRRFAGLEDGEARERLQEFLDRLIKENPGAVAVMDEIGCGIVPVGREERLWRDLAGEAAQTLAACSRDVYRVTGGLAQVLKALSGKEQGSQWEKAYTHGGDVYRNEKYGWIFPLTSIHWECGFYQTGGHGRGGGKRPLSGQPVQEAPEAGSRILRRAGGNPCVWKRGCGADLRDRPGRISQAGCFDGSVVYRV